MSQYIMRLDDASAYMDISKWTRMEELLDKYGIKPLVGIIPDNRDDDLVSNYSYNENFWGVVHQWMDKGWIPALHGYNHQYITECGGINPVNPRSEFAGLPYDEQVARITAGVQILADYNIYPKVFFAPSHTFDENTIRALLECSDIRIISDTVANKSYQKYGITFVPQQSGAVRPLPFKIVTFCYHPNTMCDKDFAELENFFSNYAEKFISFPCKQTMRKQSVTDILLRGLYFCRKKCSNFYNRL